MYLVSHASEQDGLNLQEVILRWLGVINNIIDDRCPSCHIRLDRSKIDRMVSLSYANQGVDV